MYGMINIDGKDYIERVQIFPQDVLVEDALQVLLNQRLVLPGVADFLLKGLTRTIISVSEGPIVPWLPTFKFKLGNTDGSVWYTSAGNGGTNDRVVDNLMFGDGQFPFAVIPPIHYGRSASILFEVEDLGVVTTDYTISFAFHGSYLIPAS